jgi:hypothetical protein
VWSWSFGLLSAPSGFVAVAAEDGAPDGVQERLGYLDGDRESTPEVSKG